MDFVWSFVHADQSRCSLPGISYHRLLNRNKPCSLVLPSFARWMANDQRRFIEVRECTHYVEKGDWPRFPIFDPKIH